MGDYNRYVMIAAGNAQKLARMVEIRSWFSNQWQLGQVAMKVISNMTSTEKAMILPTGVSRDYIQVLLWAMEQTDSPSPYVRRRWWLYRSKIEHPAPVDQPDASTGCSFQVPFEIPEFQYTEPVASSSRRNRRRAVGATTLPRRSPRFPRRSPRLAGEGSASTNTRYGVVLLCFYEHGNVRESLNWDLVLFGTVQIISVSKKD